MASTNLDKDIRERIQLFVAELTSLIKQSAVKSVKDALGNGDTDEPVRRRGRKGRRGMASRTDDSMDAEPSVSARGRVGRRKGAKRSPKQLENIVEKLLSHIKSNPGERIEEIAKKIGMRTRELTLPVKKLVSEKKITRKGEKRATTYFSR
jgi:hypothetical protein